MGPPAHFALRSNCFLSRYVIATGARTGTRCLEVIFDRIGADCDKFTHAGRRHEDPGQNDRRYGLIRHLLAVPNHRSVLALKLDTVLEFRDPHQWNVDAIRGRHRSQGYQPPGQWRASLRELVQGQGSDDSATCGADVALHQGLYWDGTGAASVGVIDDRVEGLVEPLPEYHGWRRSGIEDQRLLVLEDNWVNS